MTNGGPRRPLPTLEQVRALPEALDQVVPDSFADANRHMNIARYLELHNLAAWRYSAPFGLGEQQAAAGLAAVFDVEHHLRYLREVVVGDRVAVHVRLLDRSVTGIHAMQFLVNLTRGEVANTFEWVALSVDLGTRAVTPFPVGVAERLDARLRQDRALGWPVPLAGAMGLR